MKHAVVPVQGYSVSDINDTLAAGTNNVGALVVSPAVNMFARNKPTQLATYFTDSWQDADNGSCGLSIPVWSNDTDITELEWSYKKPQGGESQPLRFGDFRGYKHTARPFATSGYTAAVSYEYDAAWNPQLVFRFDSSMFADSANLNPKQVFVDSEDYQADRSLGDYFWAVLFQGYAQAEYGEPARIWRAAGNVQEDGIFAGVRMGDGGNSITINMTAADVERMMYRCTATFFLVYPWGEILGHNLNTPEGIIAIEQLVQNGKKVAVYVGLDRSNDLTYINPVPVTLTSVTNGIHTNTNPWYIAHDADVTQELGLWSSKPVKLDVLESASIWRSIETMPEGGYKPHGAQQNIVSIGFWMTPNTSINSREARIGLYNGSSWGMAAETERLEVTIIQDGAPKLVKVSPVSVSVNARPGYSENIQVTPPRESNWYLSYITPSLDDYPTNVDWVSIVDTTTGKTIVPSDQMSFTGNLQVVALFAANDSGVPRTAYALFKCVNGSEDCVLTLNQS